MGRQRTEIELYPCHKCRLINEQPQCNYCGINNLQPYKVKDFELSRLLAEKFGKPVIVE